MDMEPRTLVISVLVSICSCAGIFGNLLCAICFAHKTLRSMVSIIFFGVVLADLLFCFVSPLIYWIPFAMPETFNRSLTEDATPTEKWFWIVVNLRRVLATMTAFMLVSTCGHQLYATLEWARWKFFLGPSATLRLAASVVVCLFSAAIILTAGEFFERDQVGSYKAVAAGKYLIWSKRTYTMFFTAAVGIIIPMIATCLLWIITLTLLGRTTKHRFWLPPSRRLRRNVPLVLPEIDADMMGGSGIIALQFVVVNILSLGITCLEQTGEQWIASHLDTYETLLDVDALMRVINSSSKCFILLLGTQRLQIACRFILQEIVIRLRISPNRRSQISSDLQLLERKREYSESRRKCFSEQSVAYREPRRLPTRQVVRSATFH